MKTTKLLLILVVFLCLILFNVAACDWNGDGGNRVDSTPQPDSLQVYHLTATYGAGLLHAQLTALAGDQLAGKTGNP